MNSNFSCDNLEMNTLEKLEALLRWSRAQGSYQSDLRDIESLMDCYYRQGEQLSAGQHAAMENIISENRIILESYAN